MGFGSFMHSRSKQRCASHDEIRCCRFTCMQQIAAAVQDVTAASEAIHALPSLWLLLFYFLVWLMAKCVKFVLEGNAPVISTEDHERRKDEVAQAPAFRGMSGAVPTLLSLDPSPSGMTDTKKIFTLFSNCHSGKSDSHSNLPHFCC